MIIDRLLPLPSAPASGDELAIERGVNAYKIDYDALASAIIAQTQRDIAIVVEGNKTTHTGGAALGAYVIVHNSTISGITDGLYKAVQAIPANTAITSAYLTAVSGGGLNELNGNIASLNSKIIQATDIGTPSDANDLKTKLLAQSNSILTGEQKFVQVIISSALASSLGCAEGTFQGMLRNIYKSLYFSFAGTDNNARWNVFSYSNGFLSVDSSRKFVVLSLAVDFDSNGIGTIQNFPSGMRLLSATLDSNWMISVAGNYVVAISAADGTTRIVNNTSNINCFFMKE